MEGVKGAVTRVANACFNPDAPDAGIEDVATLALTYPRTVGSIFGAALLETAAERRSLDGLATRLKALFFDVRELLYPEATRGQIPNAFFRWVGRLTRGALEEALGASGTPGNTPSPALLDVAEALLEGLLAHLAFEFECTTSAVCFLVHSTRDCNAAKPSKRQTRGIVPWGAELLMHLHAKNRSKRAEAEAEAEAACHASPPAKRRKAEAFPETPERPHFLVQ